MKKPICIILLTCIWITIHAQTHTLTVLNGYGSGAYQSGDTINVWAVSFYNQSYFDRWTGDTITMNDPLDWHTRIVMPDHDITVEANIGQLPPEAVYLTSEIQGADTLKKVWIGFPGPGVLKGLVWMFHGTNGSGENFFRNNDMLLCVNKLMSLGYAVISMDCEEKTKETDFNGDDVYRWDYTFDSLVNIDLRNVKAIRDTMVQRGWIDAGITDIAYGYSAGGAFATHIATQLGWRAGISHNYPGVSWVAANGFTPLLLSMTQNDDNAEVGPAAAIQAQANVATLLDRHVCAAYRYALSQPLYPERFTRSADISLTLSQSIFQELKQNQVLDEHNYLLLKSEELLPVVVQNPTAWPVLLSLDQSQRVFFGDEIDETYATHRFNSDLFGSDVRFLLSLCSSTTATHDPTPERLNIYPNPAQDQVFIPNQGNVYTVFDQDGHVVTTGSNSSLDISSWVPGVYIVRCGDQTGRLIKIR